MTGSAGPHGSSDDMRDWEISVPTPPPSDDRVRTRSFLPPPDGAFQRMTTGSHSSATNPNSPHSPLNFTSLSSAGSTSFEQHSGRRHGEDDHGACDEDDSDHSLRLPLSLEPPRDIPLLPPRNGLSERRRSSRGSGGPSTSLRLSASSPFLLSPDISTSSEDEDGDGPDATPASKRRRANKKWRRRSSNGAIAATNSARATSSSSSGRRRRDSLVRPRSQNALHQQSSSLLAASSSQHAVSSPSSWLYNCCGIWSGRPQQSSSQPLPWFFKILPCSLRSTNRRNGVLWLLLAVVGGLSVSLTVATNQRLREQQQQQTILLLRQQVVLPSSQDLHAAADQYLSASSAHVRRGGAGPGSLQSELERLGRTTATSSSSATGASDTQTWTGKYLKDSLLQWGATRASTTSGKKRKKAAEKSSLPYQNSKPTLPEQQWGLNRVILPSSEVPVMKQHREHRMYEVFDRKLYRIPSSYVSSAIKSTTTAKTAHKDGAAHVPLISPRTVILHESMMLIKHETRKYVTLYPPDFTDNTQLYGILDSNDERVKTMERRPPMVEGECVPMQEWQTTFHPSCNSVHEVDMRGRPETELQLFGTKGFWRNAWRVDEHTPGHHDTLVLKTLKIEHRFEEAHFEHDRIDAVAMERLTASPHVINIFSFCGHSVMTEYADGNRLGELADKSRKIPLARLRIARDIAAGLADIHGIDGDGNATFVHLDINPANVVSIQGRLRFNDFNIGILRKWNTTSNQPCGFPAQYPNPQWRSPEEARNEQNLTEKVDIFSLGHIFFRLICGHEPWNKLEPGGKPTKQEVSEKVQKGMLPTIPHFVEKSTSPEVVAIREAMLACYEHDPTRRPSAREIAIYLQKALDKLESRAGLRKAT